MPQAKERLSTTAVTSLVAELPGHRSEVRLTRNELDDAIRQPLNDFAGVLQETVDRNGIRRASWRNGNRWWRCRIPIITTTLSEHFRAPVITTPQPELTAAIGGGLTGARGTVRRGARLLGRGRRLAARWRPLMAPEEMEGSRHVPGAGLVGGRRVPDVASTDPYDYAAQWTLADVRCLARRSSSVEHEQSEAEAAAAAVVSPSRRWPWYRRDCAPGSPGCRVPVRDARRRHLRHRRRRPPRDHDHRTARRAAAGRSATADRSASGRSAPPPAPEEVTPLDRHAARAAAGDTGAAAATDDDRRRRHPDHRQRRRHHLPPRRRRPRRRPGRDEPHAAVPDDPGSCRSFRHRSATGAARSALGLPA